MPDRKPAPEGTQQDEPGPRSFWSGALSFGLVSVPVEFWPAVRKARGSLRMLDAGGMPLARRWYCPAEERELTGDEIVRGFELDDGRFVVIEDDELESLAPEMSREIDLRLFVKLEDIPPLFFERAWFLTPGEAGSKAYRLLAKTMERTGRAGIATFVMREKEYLVAIIAERGILRAETLRFQEEIRDPATEGIPAAVKVAAEDVRSVERGIAKLVRKELALDELTDPATERLLKLVARMRKSGKRVVEAEVPVPPDDDSLDFMAALKRSLEQRAAGGAAKPEAHRRRARPPVKTRARPARAKARAR